MIDIHKGRFRVSGVQSQSTNESHNSTEISDHETSNGSLKLKPTIIKQIQNTEYRTQSTFSINFRPAETDCMDIQDLLFGHSSSPEPAVLERAVLDQDSLSIERSTTPQNALEEAIHQVREIDIASQFLEKETTSTVASEDEHSDGEASLDIPLWQKSYQCMHGHDGTEGLDNPNSKTIEVLAKMQAYYERTMDTWREISYRKVISILKKTKTFMATEEQARAYFPPK